MRHFFLIAVLGLVVSATTARADQVADDLYNAGSDYCNQSLDGYFPQVNGAPFKRKLEAAGQSQAQYCHCVGVQFMNDGDDETAAELRSEILEDREYVAMASMLENRMSHCLPTAGGTGIDLGLSDDDLNSDLFGHESIEEALADNSFAADPEDVRICQMAFADEFMLPGFRHLDELTRVRRAGQSVDEVCGCAASFITSLGEDFQQSVENADNPMVIYGSALAGGINTCINV